FLEQRAVVTGHAANHVRVDADAVIGKNGERGDVFEQAHVRGAQRERKIRRQQSGNAEAAGDIDDAVDAHFFGELHGGNVARAGQSAAQSDITFKFFVVIARRIGLAAADGGERRIQNGVERRGTFFQRVGVYVNFERAAYLAKCL